MDQLRKKYIEIMRSRIIESFLSEKEILKKELFNDAQLYEVSDEQVEILCDEIVTHIQKCENYIKYLNAKNGNYMIFDQEWKLYRDYGESFGFKENELLAILQKYEEKSKTRDKIELYNFLFRETIDPDVDEELFKEELNEEIAILELSPEESAEVQKMFEDNVLKFSGYVDEAYKNCSKEYLLNQKQILQLTAILNDLFRIDDMDERETRQYINHTNHLSGRYEKIAAKYSLNLEKKLAERFEPKTVIWKGEEIFFDGKYQFEQYIHEEYEQAILQFNERYERISKGNSDAMSQVNGWINDFEGLIIKGFKELEEYLQIPTYDYIVNIQNTAERVRKSVKSKQREWGDINEQQENARKYRENRKEHRNRFVGGGFGLSGTIKGVVATGAMNVATGAAHSMINAVGNAVTDGIANRERKDLMGSLDYIQATMYSSVRNNIKSLFKDIQKESNNLLPELDYFEETLLRKEMLNIDESIKDDFARKILIRAPYSPSTYLLVMKLYGDELEKEELQQFANEFHIDIDVDCLQYLEKKIQTTDFSETDAVGLSEILKILFKDTSESAPYELLLYVNVVNGIISRIEDEELLMDFCENVRKFDAAIPECGLLERYYNEALLPIIAQTQEMLDNEEDIKNVKFSLEFLRIIEMHMLPKITETVEKLWNVYAKKYVRKNISINKITEIEYLKKAQEEIRQLDVQFKTTGAEFEFFEIISGMLLEEVNVRATDGVLELQEYVEILAKQLRYDFSEVKTCLRDKIKKLDVESRTVCGILYESKEDADKERLKVVDGVKYDTLEMAEIKRGQFIEEKQKEKAELDYISMVETKYVSVAKKMNELYKREYVSEAAKLKISQHEANAREKYEELSAMRLRGRIVGERIKGIVWLTFAVIACVVGVKLWRIVPVIGKVIIVCVSLYMFGVMFEHMEAANDFKENLQLLVELERILKNEKK